jgi:glycosyltransferase involved in cell wall biosynthesis
MDVTRRGAVRIFFTSTSYPRSIDDWRGQFVRNLVAGLARPPPRELAVWAPPGPLPGNVRYACDPTESGWLDKLALEGGIAHVLRTGGVSRISRPLRLVQLMGRAYRREAADVFHANWLQSALPMRGTATPALLSVLGTDFALLKIPGMVRMLRRRMRGRQCMIAPNAEWMAPKLAELFGDLARVVTVPFGIDGAWYRIERRAPSGPRKWLVVSRLTRAKIGSLFEWGEKLFGADDELHLFGPQQEALAIPPWVHYHGPVRPQDLVERWFPEAAALVTLSQHDEGRPQVMLEAMAAGLPVLASRLPAHEGLVSHRQSGYLAGTREELIEGLDWLKDSSHNRTAGEAGRERVTREIGTWDDCAARYVCLYDELLERR